MISVHGRESRLKLFVAVDRYWLDRNARRGSAELDLLEAESQAQSGGTERILNIGEAVGRDREAALTVVETCWLWYRDLLCSQGGADSSFAVFGDAVRAAGRRGAGAPPSEATIKCREGRWDRSAAARSH